MNRSLCGCTGALIALLYASAAGAQRNAQSGVVRPDVAALSSPPIATRPPLIPLDSAGRSTGSLIAYTAIGALVGAVVSVAMFYNHVGHSSGECVGCIALPPPGRVAIGAGIGAAVGYIFWRLDR